MFVVQHTCLFMFVLHVDVYLTWGRCSIEHQGIFCQLDIPFLFVYCALRTDNSWNCYLSSQHTENSKVYHQCINQFMRPSLVHSVCCNSCNRGLSLMVSLEFLCLIPHSSLPVCPKNAKITCNIPCSTCIHSIKNKGCSSITACASKRMNTVVKQTNWKGV